MDADVLIAGGGLAGLTLARQLRQESPTLRITVVEKRVHPVPEAAFKVGESTVEIGAHYLQCVLGLDDHLRSGHLEKLGIRYFFPHGDNRQLEPRVEVGPPTFPAVPSFQIDRGRLENTLTALNRQAGIDIVENAVVADVAIGPDVHTATLKTSAGPRTMTARFVVDATGRHGLLRRKFDLTRPVGHQAHACWLRVRTRVRVDDWADAPAWKARVPSGERWLSTNHLMGRGYWVWLIPLGSGATSIGIVVDGTMHDYARLNRLERALEWLDEFEPQCAAVLRAERDRIDDFLALRDYAYGSARVYSPDRWALTGEAGLFTDPFYSPGSDFIAIGNDCITDLILRDHAGEDIAARAEAFNTNYLRLFDAFLRLYEKQYTLMGNAQVMTAKAAWDNVCYWCVTALLYFQRRYRDLEFMESIAGFLRRFFVLHARMQHFFRAWDVADDARYENAFTNVVLVERMRQLQAALAAPRATDDELRALLEEHLLFLERVARTFQAMAAQTDPTLARFVAPGSEADHVDLSPLQFQKRTTNEVQTLGQPL